MEEIALTQVGRVTSLRPRLWASSQTSIMVTLEVSTNTYVFMTICGTQHPLVELSFGYNQFPAGDHILARPPPGLEYNQRQHVFKVEGVRCLVQNVPACRGGSYQDDSQFHPQGIISQSVSSTDINIICRVSTSSRVCFDSCAAHPPIGRACRRNARGPMRWHFASTPKWCVSWTGSIVAVWTPRH